MLYFFSKFRDQSILLCKQSFQIHKNTLNSPDLATKNKNSRPEEEIVKKMRLNSVCTENEDEYMKDEYMKNVHVLPAGITRYSTTSASFPLETMSVQTVSFN